MANSSEITKDLILKVLRESKKLEKKDKLLEALTVLDKVANIQDSKQLEISQKVAVQIAKLCNKLINYVPNKVTYLRRAEHSLMNWVSMLGSSVISFDEKIIRMILLTYNSWATFHQSTKNYHMALSYLMKGLQIIDENDIIEADSLQFVAKTKLNVSALYSELHRYEDAINFAEECLKTLQNEFKTRLNAKDFQSLEPKEKKKAETMITTYVIAFYNIGAAEEFLNNREGMLQAFRNAVNIGTPFLNPSNEILVKVKKALMEGQSIKSKTLSFSTIRASIDENAEVRPKLKKHFRGKFSLPFGSLDKMSAKLPDDHKKQTEEVKKPGRYYSDAKLKKLCEKLEMKEGMNFVSADQFFYREISKLMNISNDCKFLRPLTTSAAMSLWDRQIEEKLRISDLRLKKHHHLNQNAEVPDAAFKVQQNIDRLKEIDDDQLKKQEIKMKSKMKTKVYKQLLRSMNGRNTKYAFPPQSKL
jgi:tetratricopeptide (TPR) repeat protein